MTIIMITVEFIIIVVKLTINKILLPILWSINLDPSSTAFFFPALQI